jgi:protease-4
MNKKSPILTVVIILGITVIVLGSIMALIMSFTGSATEIAFSERIGVIPVEGVIEGAEPIVSQLVEFRKDNRIKVIILRIDSPGGGVAPSQEIYQEVKKTTRTKKVIVSMGGLAASGGYYIAAGANRIVANPGTIVGSIGVIMEFVQVEELLKKLGVGLEVVKSGPYKDIGSPHRKLSEEERKILMEGLITDIQNQFVKAVAQGRKLPLEKVKAIADGRIFSGAKAKELGLVDQLGNFQDAIRLAKRLGGIKGDASLVYPEKPSARFWELFVQDAGSFLGRIIAEYLRPRLEYRWWGVPTAVHQKAGS